MAKTEQKDSLLTKELDLFVEHNVKDILDLHPWMSDKSFRLLTKQREIEEYIEKCIQSGICALDLETTGLNTRIVDGKPVIGLVGICLACSDKEGIYIPVGHTGYADNVPLDIAVHMLKILCNSECILIFHNFKYDGEVLRGLGIIIEDENKIEDTLLLTAVDDASRKQKGLKYLSENLIGRPMLEINNLGVESSKKKVAAFSEVSPKKAVIYGGSDAMNTYALFFKLKESMNQQDPTGSEGPWRVYKRIEKPALFVVMEMERNLAKINVEKLKKIREDILKRMEECEKNILKLAGREFDINSPKQLGEVLFNEMKIKYPLSEKNANGTYSTDVETLERVQKTNPIVSYVLNYRSYQKTLSTYVENFLKNVDKNGEIKFQLNQVQAETGRFSASGGSGIDIDGYCGVNCQNISTYNPDDSTSFDLRDAVEAHEGFVIVAIDYSGEELRIAANLSKEPNWIREFLHGTGDIHTITAKAAFSKNDVTKTERKVGKCVAKGTLVATEKGWLPIENIKKGDLVITKSGTLCPVEEVWDMGTKPGVKIETTSGHAITCGLNHRFLDTENNWVRAEDLKSGMKIKTSSCSKIDPKEKVRVNFNFWNKGNNNLISKDLPYVELNYHWGKLMGYILGDGSMHTDSLDMVCSPAYSEVKDDILRTMDILGLPHTEHLVHREGAKNPLCTIHMGSTILCRFFQHIGFRGRRGKVFRVPRVVFESPKEVSAGFLSGLFETDGTVEKSELSVTTKDKELAQDLVLLLASFGIKAYIYEHPSKKYNKVYYKVGIGREGAEIFEKDIGFISTSKNNKLKLITNKRKTTKSVVKWETTIKKVEMLDSIELMDLTVSEDHTYVAQGLITHNTLNFQTLYGGGPGSFAAKAGITIEQAKKLQANFFKNNPILRRWMDEETKITKRRMYSKTALGRRRNLKHFYMAEDSYTQSKGDRCAINSAIQGTGADIIKLALYRVWKWIHKNGYQDDVKILLPVHDEIVYEMREDKLDFLIPEIVNIMQLKDVTERMGWEVPLVVDAEYGKTWRVEHDFFKEKAKQEKNKEVIPQQPRQENVNQPEKVVTTDEVAQPQVSGDVETTTASSNCMSCSFNISVRGELLKAAPKATELKEENDPAASAAFEGKSLKDRVDGEDFFVYTVFKVDFIVSEQFTTVMKLLVYGDSSFVGHKKRIKVKTQDGKVIYTSSTPVSVDAFVALCTWLNL